ncbi:hypothetical protein EC988_002539, partial [Linderina pennispora]
MAKNTDLDTVDHTSIDSSDDLADAASDEEGLRAHGYHDGQDAAGPAGGQGDNVEEPVARPHSPRSARRVRNRLAAARMRTRQKQHLAELEQRKTALEERASALEQELLELQRQNNPLDMSIVKLAGMIDDLTKVEFSMLSGIDECKTLLQNLEQLYNASTASTATASSTAANNSGSS